MAVCLHAAAPRIETERLILRAHRLPDMNACATLWADPTVTRYIGGRPFTREEVWARLLRYTGHWPLLGYGYWAIEEKGTGEFVGELGFADCRRDLGRPLEGTPEIGWVLATSQHGRGYATEAVRAVLGWGDANLGVTRTICLIHPDNLASIRLAEKFGYREFHRTVYHGEPSLLLER